MASKTSISKSMHTTMASYDDHIPFRPETGSGIVRNCRCEYFRVSRSIYPKKAVSLLTSGKNSLKKQRAAEAVRYLKNAVELAPTFYEAHIQLGIAYRETGQNDKAQRDS